MRLGTSVLTAAMLLSVGALAPAPAQEAAPAAAKKIAPNDNPFATLIPTLTLGDPVTVGALTFVPLLAPEAPAPIEGLTFDRQSSALSFRELEWPEEKYGVEVENTGDQPVFIFGGQVLIGGTLDRVVRFDWVLPAGQTQELYTLPGEHWKDRRDDATGAFAVSDTVAPTFVRERAIFQPNKNLVPVFVSHFLTFRNDGDRRRSMQSINESTRLAGMFDEVNERLKNNKQITDPKLVGYISFVAGRVHMLEVFGSAKMFNAYLRPIVRAHAFQVAATELRAKKVGMKLVPDDEVDKLEANAVKGAKKLLGRFKSARWRNTRKPFPNDMQAWPMRFGNVEGGALAWKGRLLHGLAFPGNSFDDRLYSRPMPEETGPDGRPLQADIGGLDGGGDGYGLGELERRVRRGNASEYEKRLARRMRQNRRSSGAAKPRHAGGVPGGGGRGAGGTRR